MSTLGTILPTADSLRLSDRHAAQQAKLDAILAASNPSLSGCDRRSVGGEIRYYSGNRYATVRHQKVRWFEVRADGDYAIRP